jgi:atypical dual specificity phosphatase
MSQPHGFTWVDPPLLAAMGRPESLEELEWLRQQRIEVLISLTEDPPRRQWVNEAGLLLVHVPVVDMEPPTQDQLDKCMATIRRAHERHMAVGVHCGAGLRRTGVIVACCFVTKDMNAKNAIARVRRLRPGSIETAAQEEAVNEFARRRSKWSPNRSSTATAKRITITIRSHNGPERRAKHESKSDTRRWWSTACRRKRTSSPRPTGEPYEREQPLSEHAAYLPRPLMPPAATAPRRLAPPTRRRPAPRAPPSPPPAPAPRS